MVWCVVAYCLCNFWCEWNSTTYFRFSGFHSSNFCIDRPEILKEEVFRNQWKWTDTLCLQKSSLRLTYPQLYSGEIKGSLLFGFESKNCFVWIYDVYMSMFPQFEVYDLHSYRQDRWICQRLFWKTREVSSCLSNIHGPDFKTKSRSKFYEDSYW